MEAAATFARPPRAGRVAIAVEAQMQDTAPPPVHVARAVMRAQDRATLTTAQRDAGGWPYPSLVLVASDTDGSPLLLISRLADHTRNLMDDPRCGLLYDGTSGLTEPLSGPRVSVLGRAAPSAVERHRLRYLVRHPGAAMYAGFDDFAVWRVEVEKVHLVGGFGRIHWLAGADVVHAPDAVAGLAEREADVVSHMNEDHADAVRLYATILLGRPDGDWRMTALDADGCDLRAGDRRARLEFERPVHDAEAARAELVRLVARARRESGADLPANS